MWKGQILGIRKLRLKEKKLFQFLLRNASDFFFTLQIKLALPEIFFSMIAEMAGKKDRYIILTAI